MIVILAGVAMLVFGVVHALSLDGVSAALIVVGSLMVSMGLLRMVAAGRGEDS